MVKVEVGLSMLHCLSEPFEKMIKRVTNAETPYIEIVDDGFHALDKRRTFTLKNISESRSIKYSVHAPFADINIASPSKPILKAMLKRLEKSIVVASELDAYTWVFHPGLKTGISMFYPEMDWLQNLKTARTLSRIARDYGVKIAIENVPEPYPFLMKSVEHFTRFYREFDGEISLALDIGHANINGQIELFLDSFANKIAHIHAHDNDGKEDQHLGIGYGSVNWRNFAEKLKKIAYGKIVIVESVEHV
ncbi:MAG: sugar phosphate isomerase/epimerase family protein, partial [Candidatus Bathycorpusculaceae bacterium]